MDSAFLSACNIEETYSVDTGSPAASCTCVLSKAEASPGSGPGAGGYSADYISRETKTIKASEDRGEMPLAVIQLATAFYSQVNAC